MIPPCLRVCPNIEVHSGHAARTRVSWVVFAQIISIKRQLRGTARSCHANPIFFVYLFRLAACRFSGSVEDYPVPAITVDTATDMCVVSHAWLMSHPTLRSVTIQPVPPTAVDLQAANGSSLNVLGFVVFSHARYDNARCRSVSCTVPWARFNTPS